MRSNLRASAAIKERVRQRRVLPAGALVLSALVSGCGGGGGPTSTPPPAAAPTPSPTPTPTPAAVFETPEYQRSNGPAFHNVIPAWQRGATGQGVGIGIVDSGIDTSNPEFAGRISSASTDVAGARGVQGEDDHGTDVALVAAAARNGSGIVGIAYQATILAMRADTPGTCATSGSASGCKFADSAVAAGIDRAAQNGAKVINLSLGGNVAGAQARAAVTRAADADVVVVIAAGNDADGTNATNDPNNPDPFAAGLRAAGRGNVIIAGSVNGAGAISAFSNRAGSEADWVLMALGERICCVYENGAIRVTTNSAGQQVITLISGTSFSAPQISGAVALLRQAFPNLTAAQTVDLLLRTARDAGDPGVDAIYGRGILDIANAFNPQGTTIVAGTNTALALSAPSGATSPAMGDAAQRTSLNTVVLDAYGRAFGVDLGGSLRGARTASRLAGALTSRTRELSTDHAGLSLAYSIDGADRVRRASALRLTSADADRSRVLAARMIAQVTPETRLGLAFAENADGLAAVLQGGARPAFLIAGSPLNDTGFFRQDELSFGLRRSIGPWGLTVTAERGLVRDDSARGLRERRLIRTDLGAAYRYAARLDRSLGRFDFALGAGGLDEQRTVLGARFNPALASGGSRSLFLDLDAAFRPGDAWRLGGSLRRVWTRPHGGGLLAEGSRLIAQGWSLDVARSGVFTAGDSLALRLAQPLRVTAGGLYFDLPTYYDYATLAATTTRQRLSLVPRGREIIGELAWRGTLWGGSASTSLYYRKDPGHYADAPDDAGIAVSWSGRF